MKILLVGLLFSGAVARAICWTLVHSLWLGVAAALVAGIVILCTKRRRAALRYNLLMMDLLLTVVAIAGVFVYEVGSVNGSDGNVRYGLQATIAGNGTDAGHLTNAGHGTDAALGTNVGQGTDEGHGAFKVSDAQARVDTVATWMKRAGVFLNDHAVAVSLIWLICLSIQCLRLTGGLYKAARLRKQGIMSAGTYWDERILLLSRRLGVVRSVRLLQSGILQAPATLGWLKPIILIPMGMLSNLPPDQVETIILHELAHIRRNDYMMNIMLLLTQAIFFFNPGLRWVIVLVRREREACCDDMVMDSTSNRESYLEALIGFTQMAIDGKLGDSGRYALQFGGGRTDLFWRIRRMLEKENKKLQVMEKAILSFGLMGLVGLSLLSMSSTSDRVGPHSARIIMNGPSGSVVVNADTVQPGKKISLRPVSSNIEINDDDKKYNAVANDAEGNRYQIRMHNDDVTFFKRNDKTIPKDEYGQLFGGFLKLSGFSVIRLRRPRRLPFPQWQLSLPI